MRRLSLVEFGRMKHLRGKLVWKYISQQTSCCSPHDAVSVKVIDTEFDSRIDQLNIEVGPIDPLMFDRCHVDPLTRLPLTR